MECPGDTPWKNAGIACVHSGFEGIRGKMEGLKLLKIGVDQSAVNFSCKVVLYSEFESKQALDAYAVHLKHLRVRQEPEGLRITRHQMGY